MVEWRRARTSKPRALWRVSRRIPSKNERHNAHTRAPSRLLREEIGKYLTKYVVGVDSRDPEGFRLLQAVAEFLHRETRETVVNENLSAPIIDTLKTIQDRPERIEKQGSTKTPLQGSYASVAAAGRVVGKAGIAPNAAMKEEESFRGRRLRELVIRIENEAEREQSKTNASRAHSIEASKPQTCKD